MSEGMKLVLEDQFAACYNDKSWFPTLQEALEGLDAQQAGHVGSEGLNSIWQLTSHLLYWNRVYLERFKQKAITDSGHRNEETFHLPQLTEEAWQTTVVDLFQVMQAWRDVLAAGQEQDLLDQISHKGYDVAWWQFISNVSIHNAYHIGQIIVLRKLYGNWTNKY
ncbi:DinB family protein [Paenibacillus sp. ACRRX]|uniref:DinB family protein n=1 Tax=Paenibacillus sp. ACRRX TaxID=2918206 RepID=UPI001EF49B6C|nr:DinB family protein [Paenibacillus sp. ACRRX]MCG7407291.1 DinB family protein [Paenibacillus sp. ACRRX]